MLIVNGFSHQPFGNRWLEWGRLTERANHQAEDNTMELIDGVAGIAVM
jgi:hypothetical protein